MTLQSPVRTARRAALAASSAALLLIAGSASAQQARVVRVSLPDALQLAESRSEAVAIARAGLTRASGNRYIARSQLMPQLSGTAGYTKTLKSQFEGLSGPAPDTTGPASLCAPRIPANATQAQRDAAIAQATTCRSGSGFDLSGAGFGAKNQWQLGLNASYNVFSGGRASGQTQAATAQERSARIEVDAQRAQVKLDIAQAYFDAALADRLVGISQASLAQTEEVLKQTQLGREVGDVSEFDLLRAQVTRDNQRPALIQAQSNRDVAYLRLKQLLEMPLDDSLLLSTTLDDTTSTTGLVSVAAPTAATPSVEARAPVRELEQAVIAQQGLLKAARAEAIPSVSIISGYQRLYFPQSFAPDLAQARQNWTVGVSTNFSLFTGGRIHGSTLVAQGNLDETRQRLQQTRELAALDAHVAQNQLAQAQAAYQASAGTAEQARRALEIDQLRYKEGISTQTDLAQSRLLFEQAVANRATAARNLAVAKMRIQLLNDLPIQVGGASGAAQQQQQQPPQQQTPTSTTPSQSGSTGRPGGQPDGPH
jgi:outer membrane protein